MSINVIVRVALLVACNFLWYCLHRNSFVKGARSYGSIYSFLLEEFEVLAIGNVTTLFLVGTSFVATIAMSAHIAEHYNKRRSETLDQRNQSPIIHLRNFNNWIKSVLLNKYVKPGHIVFDICAGKGGDLKKFAQGRIEHLVLAGKISHKYFRALIT